MTALGALPAYRKAGSQFRILHHTGAALTWTFQTEEFGKLAHTSPRMCCPYLPSHLSVFAVAALFFQAVHKLGAKVDESGAILPYVVPRPQTVEPDILCGNLWEGPAARPANSCTTTVQPGPPQLWFQPPCLEPSWDTRSSHGPSTLSLAAGYQFVPSSQSGTIRWNSGCCRRLRGLAGEHPGR